MNQHPMWIDALKQMIDIWATKQDAA